MKNRGSISTSTIDSKLKKVEDELGIAPYSTVNEKFTPLLFINGRLNRKNCTYIAKNFSLLAPLNAEIKKICKGSDLTVLNYLIFLGLKTIKDNAEFQSIEYSDFESKV
jgi:hypothetical protein